MTEQQQTASERPETTTLPAGKDPMLRVIPMPADANYTGDIFGGWIMSQVDLAGSVPAMRLAKGRVATIAVDVTVYAQRRAAREECVRVTEAVLTYVAVDANRRPRVVSEQQ